MAWRIAGPLAGALLAALIAVPAAWGSTFTVGTTNDTAPATRCSTFPSGCSLRQLIEHENGLAATPSPPDTIVVPTGTYSLTQGPLVVDQSVTIAGAGARTTEIAQGTTSVTSRVFDIQKNANLGLTPTVVISGLSVAFGKADSTNGSFGGDVRNAGILTLGEDLIEGGTATSGSGGGISNYGGTMTVTHSLIWQNSSTNPNGVGGDSGGIQNYGDAAVGPGHLTVIDSTIANNTSALGGGIFSWEGSAPRAPNATTIINSTIAFNDGGTRTDQPNAGGLLASAGTITVENSIVASNTVTNPTNGVQTPSNCGGTVSSLGHNLETGTDCSFTSSGDLQSADPQFASSTPQDNGGNTNTLEVAFVSPVVDHIPAGASGCTGTDQRDVPRPQGSACDIGAFEYAQPTEGAQFSGALVIAANAVSSQPTPTVNWGDGTSSPATFPSTPISGPIGGSHAYAEEGTYTVTVSYTDDGGSHSPSFQLKVPDAALTSAGTSLTAQAGTAVSGPIATFTDADPGGSASDYTTTISWGDGSASAGKVTTSGAGFQVAGTHTYATGGVYTTNVSISDAGGANTVAHGTVTVASAPSPVITGAPTVSTTTAAFFGSVNPDGLPTNANFQYGLDPKYSGGGPLLYTSSTPAQNVGSDFATHVVTASVAGLVPNALYHVRLVATNSAGTTFGPDVTFTTGKSPAPGSPRLGKTFNVSLVSGLVLVKVNGQLIPLTELTQIPKNTLIDALHGTISLTTAVPGPSGARDAAAKGKKHKTKTQKGTFGGAIFKISQATRGTGKGLVTLAIVEGAFKSAPTFTTCKAHKAIDATAASSRTLQLLHASAHGRFRTKGRYSSATVLGTKWTVADRCDGTLTHDITDSVKVTDFVHHKTITLHAGQSYLAKKP